MITTKQTVIDELERKVNNQAEHINEVKQVTEITEESLKDYYESMLKTLKKEYFDKETEMKRLNLKQAKEHQDRLNENKSMKTFMIMHNMQKENNRMKVKEIELKCSKCPELTKQMEIDQNKINSLKMSNAWSKRSGDMINCPKCPNPRPNVKYSNIQKHLLKVHETTIISRPCEKCNKEVTANDLEEHMTYRCKSKWNK